MDITLEIKKIVGEVLEIENPDELTMETEFFEIGGNSLTAMMAVESIQNQFLIDFDYSGLYEHTTIGDIVRLVEEKLSAKTV